MTSRHHWIMTRIISTSPRVRACSPYPWNHAASPTVRENALAAPIIGHGLNSTKW